MKIYHGSTVVVDSPKVDIGRDNLDFGKGFYTTNIKQQAIDWAKRPLNKGKKQYVSTYEFDLESALKDGYRILSFKEYNEEWLNFVVGNRRGEQLWEEYDIIEGGIANDRVFNTIELYAAGLITQEAALQKLIYEKPNNQICILRQAIIDKFLTFIEYQELS